MFVPEVDTTLCSSVYMSEAVEMYEYISLTEDVRSLGRHNLGLLSVHDGVSCIDEKRTFNGKTEDCLI